MSVDKRLKKLVPINSLNDFNFQELIANTKIVTYQPNQVIFKEGDMDKLAVYVLKGEVVLTTVSSSFSHDVIGETDESRFALAQLRPRQYTATAKTEAIIAAIDNDALDRLVTWDQSQAAGMEVTEIAGSQEDTEWLMDVLRSKTFEKLPPSNVNDLFSRMEEVSVKTNQVIIKQGDPGDYFYIIKSGHATVSRKAEKSGKVVILSELKVGEGFGEEALLSGSPRNASVIMMSDGVLMRLNKKSFDQVLKKPMVHWLSEEQATQMLRQGAQLIDVRLEDEFRNGSLKGSLNMPLYLLRLKTHSMDPKKKYIVYCQSGNRSCAAAFLMSQRGFNVYVLRGGLEALHRARAS